MVEFVLLLPVFLLIVFGGITAALAYEHKSEVVHAVRDGARYGSTVPLAQCDTIASCGSRNWAELVQYVTAQRSDGTPAPATMRTAGSSSTSLSSRATRAWGNCFTNA